MNYFTSDLKSQFSPQPSPTGEKKARIEVELNGTCDCHKVSVRQK